jgi:type IV pilus assembly protein PilP
MSTDMKPPHRAVATATIVVALAAFSSVAAQQLGQAPPAQPAPAQPQSAESQPAQTTAKPSDTSAPFTYTPEGRRDPFVSLIGKGSDPKVQGTRPPGIPGLLINEVSVKGIVRNSSGYVALIQGADNKTYIVKAGDRLLDGTVKSILQDAVVFSQDVSDPLSLVKQKEIRKPLRSAEGGRG